MVLLVGSESGSINKPERESFHRLSSASSTTLNATTTTPTTRVSKRILLVHLFHTSLLALTTSLLVVGVFRWEHGVAVNTGQALYLSSYLTLGMQAFFTGVVLLLYETIRNIAVDAAIRHPQTLMGLSIRLSAWSGLPASISNWFNKPASETVSRFGRGYRAIYFGIPLYLICGGVLQLSASAVIGVNLYDHAFNPVHLDFAAASHYGDYGTLAPDEEDYSWLQTNRLWAGARENMFVSHVNDTRWPGLQGNILHDVPVPGMLGYPTAHVNATGINIQCGQPSREDVLVEILLLPSGTQDIDRLPASSIVRSNGSSYIMAEQSMVDLDLWLNVSLPKPPYWDQEKPGLNITSPWAEAGFDDSLPMRIVLQPWLFSADGAIGHHQVVFVLGTSDPELLIRGADNSTGWSSKFDFIPVIDSDESAANFTSFNHVTAYIQVIGCSMYSQEMEVTLTQTGMLAKQDTPPSKADRQWAPFAWEDLSSNTLDRQFLITWTPDEDHGEDDVGILAGAPVEKLLRQTLVTNDTDGSPLFPLTLGILEDKLERLTASYLYNYWRKCQGPLMAYSFECQGFRTEAESRLAYSASATFDSIGTSARLEINVWRAAISFCASLIMLALAVGLLGWRTDLENGEEMRMRWTVVEAVTLMRDSGLPTIVADYGSDNVRIRYRPAGEGVFANLDHNESEKSA